MMPIGIYAGKEKVISPLPQPAKTAVSPPQPQGVRRNGCFRRLTPSQAQSIAVGVSMHPQYSPLMVGGGTVVRLSPFLLPGLDVIKDKRGCLKINKLTRYPSVGHIAEETVAGYSNNLKRIKPCQSQVSDLSGLKSSLCLALKLQIEQPVKQAFKGRW